MKKVDVRVGVRVRSWRRTSGDTSYVKGLSAFFKRQHFSVCSLTDEKLVFGYR